MKDKTKDPAYSATFQGVTAYATDKWIYYKRQYRPLNRDDRLRVEGQLSALAAIIKLATGWDIGTAEEVPQLPEKEAMKHD